MAKTQIEKKKVTFTVPEELYFEYKKCLIDQRTTPTADFIRHMRNVVGAQDRQQQENESDE